jgi:hypothetical protein
MGPLGKIMSKCLFPADGVPIVAGLINDLSAAFGCTRIACVTGHLGWQVEEVLPQYAGNVELVFIREPEAQGTAAAVLLAMRKLEMDTFVYAHGDIRVLPSGVHSLRKVMGELDPHQSLVATTELPIAPTHPVLPVQHGRVAEADGSRLEYSVGVAMFRGVTIPSQPAATVVPRESIEAWLTRNTRVLAGARAVSLGDEWLHLEDLRFYERHSSEPPERCGDEDRLAA